MELILSICLGVGLAASSGFRVFMPLFAMSLASYFGVLPMADKWSWVGSEIALVILGVASLVEALAYMIPLVDHVLDAIAIPLVTVVGTVLVAMNLNDLSPAITWTLAVIAGGGTAVAVKGTSSATRLTSTVTTAATANPVVSLIETVMSAIIAAAAIFLPVVVVVLIFVLVLFFVFIIKKLKKAVKK